LDESDDVGDDDGEMDDDDVGVQLYVLATRDGCE
jgi:hypothetical protein